MALHLQSDIVIRRKRQANQLKTEPTDESAYFQIDSLERVLSTVYGHANSVAFTITKSSHSRNVCCNDDNSSSLFRKLCVLSNSECDPIVRPHRHTDEWQTIRLKWRARQVVCTTKREESDRQTIR